jgi:hypothetical protein
LTTGLLTNLPFDENSPHSVDQPTPRWFRFPCSANAAPCGSLHRAIQLPSGNSSGPSKTWPPPLFTRFAAASMSSILK